MESQNVDLSRFDRVEYFTCREIACLMNGFDPVLKFNELLIESDIRLIVNNSRELQLYLISNLPALLDENHQLDYLFSSNQMDALDLKLRIHGVISSSDRIDLSKYSDEIKREYISDIDRELKATEDSDIIEEIYGRQEIHRWVQHRGYKSKYCFGKEDISSASSDNSIPSSIKDITENSNEIDPADLPDELSAANIAFRAVTNGYGDPMATFRNRLINYLEKDFPGLNGEAVQRIATVANPDKAPGRKKRNAE